MRSGLHPFKLLQSCTNLIYQMIKLLCSPRFKVNRIIWHIVHAVIMIERMKRRYWGQYRTRKITCIEIRLWFSCWFMIFCQVSILIPRKILKCIYSTYIRKSSTTSRTVFNVIYSALVSFWLQICVLKRYIYDSIIPFSTICST